MEKYVKVKHFIWIIIALILLIFLKSIYLPAADRSVLQVSSIPSPIELNNSTSVKILDYYQDRMSVEVCNIEPSMSGKFIYLKLQPASTDNEKKGIVVFPGQCWSEDSSKIYVGEISAISNFNNIFAYVTEY